MNEAAAAVIILLAKYGPVLVEEILTVAHKNDASLSEWLALFNRVKTYEDYVKPLPFPPPTVPATPPPAPVG